MYFHTSEQEKLELGFGNHSCNWGIHICCLYETEKERDEVIFNYLSLGIKKGILIYTFIVSVAGKILARSLPIFVPNVAMN